MISNRRVSDILKVIFTLAFVIVVFGSSPGSNAREPGTHENPDLTSSGTLNKSENSTSEIKAATSGEIALNIPTLYEFGAGKCKQCKQMKPIIEALAKELQGRVTVKAIDVNSDEETTEKFKIMLIPCQIILDAEGKEIFRHEGALTKEEILAELAKAGVKNVGVKQE
jgi:thioredoxin 1